MDLEQHYSDHLDTDSLLKQIKTRYPDGPNAYQLAPVDQLHIGGIKSSEKLLKRLEQINPTRILEIGSGLGGLMRLISDNFKHTELIGIDITHRFNLFNNALTSLNPTNKPVQTITCDAQQMPFADNRFDCIIFQHSLLNIPDTKACLAECHRVLSSGGTLLLHEVLEGSNPEQMRYPVPWARQQKHSHLIPLSALEQRLSASGFFLYSNTNWSEEALQWRQRQASKEKTAQPVDTISPALVLGQEFKKMGPNVMANLNAGAVEVRELICRRD